MKLSACYTADFETTTDENDCRVWAYSICSIEDVSKFWYGNNIDDFFEWCRKNDNPSLWFHNLKFDGTYIINWLFENGFKWVEKEDIGDKTFTTLITDMGQFYQITVYFKHSKKHCRKVTFFDSLKILNFSVEKIAEDFDLPIRKLSIDYNKPRPVGYIIQPDEVDYIRNDVEIMARALQFMFLEGQTKMTIAGDAMKSLKETIIGFRKKFPVLPKEVDAEIRKSYRGGFTYVNETWQGKEVGKGIILDVNSLYPYCMTLELPFGEPVFFEGEYQDDPTHPLYVQSLTCAFELKPGKIPSIQLKNNLSFMPNEYVKSSKGKVVTLYLTSVDLQLFKDQYNFWGTVWNGGFKFMKCKGIFDKYVQMWTAEKIKAGKEKNKSKRQLAKLMLNSSYGRLSLSPTAKQKKPFLDHEEVVRFELLPEEEREPVYIPCGAFITALGREKTIRTSQAIRDYTIAKYGEDRYYYSDTDSIHANLSPEDLEELKDLIKIDKYELGCWDEEAKFTKALYIRQKCYIEMIDGKVEVTVAGLPKYLAPIINFDNFKKGFSTGGMTHEQLIEMAKKNGATDEEIEKLHHKFRYKYVKGGVILADTDFTIN
jgi:hypothetical protein